MARFPQVKPSSQSLEQADKEFLWHPFTQHYLWEKDPTIVIASARGVTFTDTNGKTYIDGVSSLWVNLVGHNNAVINRALRNQISKMSHTTFLGLSHQPAIELGIELAKIAPRGLTRTFYSDSGATSVEIALKMAFQFWIEQSSEVRPEFLALQGSYHGDTIGAVSVGGIGAFHSKFKPLLFQTNFAMAPACYRCPYNKKNISHRFRTGEKITEVSSPGDPRPETGCRWECLGSVETILKEKAKKISAAIMEPVMQAAGGMHVLPQGYVAGFRKLCSQYNVLMIADEVATGFCRTSAVFAVDQENVIPDILCVAKSLTGGYSPLAATITSNRLFNAFYGPITEGRTFFHGHSYTAHPLGCAAAVANLRLIRRINLLEKSRRLAHLLRAELETFSTLAHVGRVHQAGLMVGIELVENKETKTAYHPQQRMGAHICKTLLSHGIWIRPLGDVLVILPPPVISAATLRLMVRRIRTVIRDETEK